MKTTPCTEKRQYAFDSAPRCDAKARTNNYSPCRNPAVRGRRKCRMHGGAKGSGAPRDNVNALKHGETTAKVRALKSEIRQTIQHSKHIIQDLSKLLQ